MKRFFIPKIINPDRVRIVMVCEAMPADPNDYFYSSRQSLYVMNTIDSFNNAGIFVKTIEDIVQRGVYLTVAVKSPRKGLTVPAKKIENDSYMLEEELKMFPKVKAILLMGDAAIKALNFISKRTIKAKVIPSGSTYKIRKGKFYFGNIRIFPSYLQTGRNFLIERSKRAMVAADIKNAFEL